MHRFYRGSARRIALRNSAPVIVLRDHAATDTVAAGVTSGGAERGPPTASALSRRETAIPRNSQH
ncbi:MAG: hypothetical protein BGP08_17950 [Rhizobiales bacterium 64-17]|nr:MAG: hypothetical protein BGP08_17950 [Rhizobiales bacterium 64-17]